MFLQQSSTTECLLAAPVAARTIDDERAPSLPLRRFCYITEQGAMLKKVSNRLVWSIATRRC
jgi:hypothetical protein